VPCLIRHIPLQLAPTDRSLPPDRTVANLAEASRFESDNGVYAVFATWHEHRVVCLSKHFDRLEDSANRAGFSLSLDREQLREQLRLLASDSGFGEVKIRISATPQSGSLMVSVEPYPGPPADLQRRGVRCESETRLSRTNPRAKQTRWILERSRSMPAGGNVYEQLLVDQAGRILEGTSSNFYAVRRTATDSPGAMVLQTADTGILPGITRAVVMDVAREVVAVDLTAPLLNERHEFTEAFLTSASRGIVPIVGIDGLAIGPGHPGEITRTLIERYRRRAKALEEEL